MIRYCLTLLFLISSVFLYAETDPSIVESKVKSDLDGLISRVLPRNQYVLQVNAQGEKRAERQLVEGETVQQSANLQNIPVLPGFESETDFPAPQAPQQSRQVFKMVEKPVLTSVRVLLTFDEQVSQELQNSIENSVRTYLSSNFGPISSLVLSRLAFSPETSSQSSSVFLWVLVGILAFCLALFGLWWRGRSTSFPRPIRTVDARLSDTDTNTNIEEKSRLYSDQSPSVPLALPSSGDSGRGTFPPVPAEEKFVCSRSNLLELFLAHSDSFRPYFERLEKASQAELYAGLRGPAFDSFLAGLGLEIPAAASAIAPPTQEQMLFYDKNFKEFLKADSWQSSRLFGFLQHLNREQVLALFQQQNPLVGSLILRFLSAENSAWVLEALTSENRIKILSQLNLVSKMTPDEIKVIEKKLREDTELLPKYLVGSTKRDIELWKTILSQAQNPDDILLDLEHSRPELYEDLAPFRFKLEDIPTLPPPLIAKVLEGVDNEELTLALLTCPDQIGEFMMDKLSSERRQLIQHQIVSFRGIPEIKTVKARNDLTRKFREVVV